MNVPAAALIPSDPVVREAPPGHRWVVVHSRPRAEKRVVEFCAKCGAPSYLPVRTKTHRYGARVRTFTSPLFPGYVFCMADDAVARLLRQNRHAANLLEVIDQPTLVRQLEQVERALLAGDVLEVLPFLEEGRRVRVLDGPFKGVEGYVQRIRGATRVILNVDIIQSAVAVEVDSCHLGPG